MTRALRSPPCPTSVDSGVVEERSFSERVFFFSFFFFSKNIRKRYDEFVNWEDNTYLLYISRFAGESVKSLIK